jgi:hypothetical protein
MASHKSAWFIVFHNMRPTTYYLPIMLSILLNILFATYMVFAISGAELQLHIPARTPSSPTNSNISLGYNSTDFKTSDEGKSLSNHSMACEGRDRHD